MGHVWAHITYPSIAHVAPIRCHFPNFNMGPMWECNNLPSGINTWVMYGPHITYPLITHVAPIRCHFPNFNMGPMWECNNLPSGIPTICPHDDEWFTVKYPPPPPPPYLIPSQRCCLPQPPPLPHRPIEPLCPQHTKHPSINSIRLPCTRLGWVVES